MFEHLSASERRRLLFASRVRFGAESKVPRQRAIDRIVENALYLAGPNEWFSIRDILNNFRDVGNIPTLRVAEVEAALKRLQTDGRIQKTLGALRPRYRLSDKVGEDVEAAYKESSRRFEAVLNRLFADLFDGPQPDYLAAFFLEFTCDVFCALGAQWASYIKGDPLRTLIDVDRVEEIASAKVKKYKLPDLLSDGLRRRCLQFLQSSDPDYDYLKFALGQSYYVMHLLGAEGSDLLSEEVFSKGKLYLDSSVVIPALLSESRHYPVFEELLKVCRRLGISLFVARPTVDEVRNVVAEQARLAPGLYDKVPEALSPNVFGDFFQTYYAWKKTNPSATPEQLFEPFQRLSDTLSSTLGVQVVDDKVFETMDKSPEFRTVKDVLQRSSQKVRRRQKFENALVHDAKVFLFLRGECTSPESKLWLVTRDSSLPGAWSELQPQGLRVRCFLLDGLLQSICPFVVDEGDVREFSQVFSRVVAAQLVPQGRLFDIEDFLLFQDLHIDCQELPTDEIEEGLLAVKKHVLRGAAYRRDRFEDAAYELRRVMARHAKGTGELAAQRDKLERKIESMTESHHQSVQDFQSRIQELEEREQRRNRRRSSRLLFVKKMTTILVIAFTYYGVAVAALRFGLGTTRAERLLSFVPVLPVATGFVLWLAKLTIFPRERLAEVFKSWREVKDLLD